MTSQISLTTEPELLVESDQTTATLNFNLSEPAPPEGITVTINTTNLSEFNLNQIQIEGGEITLEDEVIQQLETNLDGTRAEEVPGAAVAIVSPLGSWFGASGVANLEDNIPLQPGDRFEIGSITKTFVATTVLQLVEEGVLSLEDTLTDWLPDAVTADIPNAAEITIEQLLQHTSGVADYVDLLFNQAATNPAVFVREWQPEELVDLIDDVEPSFEPGDWYYSNTNYILAGLVVEAATGNNIAEEIRDRILDPLDLNNTFFAGEEEIPGSYVSGYWDFDQNGTLDNINITNLSWAWATGAMVSNTEDLDTFARSLFAGDLLQPETLEPMLDTVPAINNDNYSSYGLGVGTIESPNRFWYIHRGQTLGYRSNMWYSPQDDLTYIELINGFSTDNLVRDLLPTYREGTTDNSFNFSITEQQAQIIIPIADDGEVEPEETVTFSLEAGEEYEVDSNANSGTFTIVDAGETSSEPNIGLGVFPDSATEGESLTFFFEVDGLIPEDGLYVYVDSDTPQSLSSQFDLSAATVDGGELPLVNADESGFAINILEDSASVTIPTILDEVDEVQTDFTYELKTRDQISEIDLTVIETAATVDEYQINPAMAEVTVTINDFEEGIEVPTTDLELLFGTLEGDVIEVEGNNQLVFTGDSNDLSDLSSGGSNHRVYAGSGDDTLILGAGSRVIGGEGGDRFFVTSGGDNAITGGADADEFWIVTAEIPDAANIITDFTSGEDVLGVAGLGIGFSDLNITDTNAGVLINAHGSDLAILQGIAADSLTQSDFAFG